MFLTENEVHRLIERASDYDGSMSKMYFAELVEQAVMRKIMEGLAAMSPDFKPNHVVPIKS